MSVDTTYMTQMSPTGVFVCEIVQPYSRRTAVGNKGSENSCNNNRVTNTTVVIGIVFNTQVLMVVTVVEYLR